ncbi:hypothetical protein SCUP234_02542 [Seiridium cupressi]
MSSKATPEHFPAENGVHVWRAAVVVPPITVVFVALRFYSRLYILRRKMTVDDCMLAPKALVCESGLTPNLPDVVLATMGILITHAALIALATYHGMGLHIWQYTPELNSEYYFWLALSSIFYTTSLLGFKNALLLLYLQTFGANKKFRIACYITLALTWAYLIPAILTEFLGCWPPAKKWSPEIEGHCMYDVPAKIFYGAGHAISDMVILSLPLAIIWRLKFSTVLQKIGLSAILCSGFIAMAVGIARWAITIYNMVSYDRPWWAGISFTLSILEPNLGIICACVATFSPLVQLSYARSKHWTAAKKENFGVERDLEIGPRRPSDTALTTHKNEEPVLGVAIYPTESDPFAYDLHGLQALECGHVQPQNQTMQQPHPTQADDLHNWAPATPYTTYPHSPEDIGYFPQSSGTAQSALRHFGHNQHPDMGLPKQFHAESAYPAYYTEFPSDLGQNNVNNPVYYDATWSQVHQQPTYEKTYTG